MIMMMTMNSKYKPINRNMYKLIKKGWTCEMSEEI